MNAIANKPVDLAALQADVKWNADGLVAAVVQDAESGRVLMMAWMNREALELTVTHGDAVYWSRSRQSLWRKGERSGNSQRVSALYLDCDGDCLLLAVRQRGGVACHTGRESCFYRRWQTPGFWQIIDPVRQDPAQMYREESPKDASDE